MANAGPDTNGSQVSLDSPTRGRTHEAFSIVLHHHRGYQLVGLQTYDSAQLPRYAKLTAFQTSCSAKLSKAWTSWTKSKHSVLHLGSRQRKRRSHPPAPFKGVHYGQYRRRITLICRYLEPGDVYTGRIDAWTMRLPERPDENRQGCSEG